jgi:hypothetical protein
MATATKRGNWTDEECYYVSVVDGKRYNFLAGPFQTHQEALDRVDGARKIGQEMDPKAWFYGFGTCKAPNGYREGLLNVQMGI